ncbi:GNAT family N-acetyltransferase [Methylogaea oryzae]|uniref:Acetyltransferase n=1 Tax=Methylogaea oryzae TaxID=1295382 RepID=A0A8D5AP63_9GAMM|nr:GNAT family N-acetyltransferase [Methylogaea oryzae]BBL72750.1 acetyltransferase [Methylogaea oryzae]
MPADWRIEPLARNHIRADFDCGEPELNDYLVKYARQNQDHGLARTFVAVLDDAPDVVAGYYALTVGALDKTHLPPAAAKRLPSFPLPIARLARLAVDRRAQGQGLGEDLLMDALHRCLTIADQAGVLAVLVDAKHPTARAFYTRYEFDSLPDQPLPLWLPMAAIRRLFGSGE